MPANQRRQMYYGYAFESWCTASSPSSPPGWGGDVDTNVQWCSVVKTKIGSTRLVIGGEVDCVRGLHRLSLSLVSNRACVRSSDAGRYSGKNDTMVELKTSMNIRGAQDEARFEKSVCVFVSRDDACAEKLRTKGNCSSSTSNRFFWACRRVDHASFVHARRADSNATRGRRVGNRRRVPYAQGPGDHGAVVQDNATAPDDPRQTGRLGRTGVPPMGGRVPVVGPRKCGRASRRRC